MEPEIVTPSEPVTPVETGEPEDTSLAAHEAAFGKGGSGTLEREDGVPETTEERDERGRFRHRASSQRANPEDVPQINALTKELRAKEQELAKARPESVSGSPRLLALRRQIKAIEAELGELKPKPAAVERPAIREPEKPEPASTFSEKEPSLDDFANEADPYSAWNRALARYDRRKEAFEADQAADVTRREARQREQQQQFEQRVATYAQRVTEFTKTHPDFQTALAAVEDRNNVTPILAEAIYSADNGPALVYHLAQHPQFYDEMFLLTDGKPLTDAHVAVAQRRLHQHWQAASTGSAAVSRTLNPPPRPPNPVRTGPIHTGDELPGDESSLAEHEKAFGPKRRR